jgi:hypothetical protein
MGTSGNNREEDGLKNRARLKVEEAVCVTAMEFPARIN